MVCPRCDGKKVLPHYSHVANGVCFMCKGFGSVSEGNLFFRKDRGIEFCDSNKVNFDKMELTRAFAKSEGCTHEAVAIDTIYIDSASRIDPLDYDNRTLPANYREKLPFYVGSYFGKVLVIRGGFYAICTKEYARKHFEITKKLHN